MLWTLEKNAIDTSQSFDIDSTYAERLSIVY